MSKITIKELAKQLNISISTVSRALNDSYETSKETKSRVKEMAEQLGYKPDLFASNLRSGKSRTIAVIIPEIVNSFFAEAIEGIEEVCRQNAYQVIVCLTHEDRDNEITIAKHLLDGRLDGVLISVTNSASDMTHIKAFKDRDIPVVFFDRICEDFKTFKVVTDDYESSYNATRSLIENGCRNVAYLSLSGFLSISKRRLSGYQCAIADMGLKENVLHCGYNDPDNEWELRNLLLGEDKPDGILCSVEKLGVSIYKVCNELRLNIPQHVQIISFSNQKLAPFLNPSLSTITQPAFEIGKKAVGLLIRSIKTGQIYQEDDEIVLPSILIQRGSTSALA